MTIDGGDDLRIVRDIAREAGGYALSRFREAGGLLIRAKGHQDWVSDADERVEALVRERLAEAFPDDGIVGEEQDETPGTSGRRWVIDPIDGTTNFLRGIPMWCTVIAGVQEGETRLGVIHDAAHGETFAARLGGGATLNDEPLALGGGTAMAEATIALGMSGRAPGRAPELARDILAEGALFARNGSGALSLAWVAAGRYAGYLEAHMNAWDCIAGQLIVSEAGGRVEAQDADAMIANGGRVVVGHASTQDALVRIADAHWRRGPTPRAAAPDPWPRSRP